MPPQVLKVVVLEGIPLAGELSRVRPYNAPMLRYDAHRPRTSQDGPASFRALSAMARDAVSTGGFVPTGLCVDLLRIAHGVVCRPPFLLQEGRAFPSRFYTLRGTQSEVARGSERAHVKVNGSKA